jgi:hypothetical protein
MARRRVGSNQYRTRVDTPDLQIRVPHLMARVLQPNATQRRDAAEDPRTSAKVLVHLAGDTSWWVSSGVAENPHTPPELLRQLVRDEAASVHQAALKNPNCPEEYRALHQVTQ